MKIVKFSQKATKSNKLRTCFNFQLLKLERFWRKNTKTEKNVTNFLTFFNNNRQNDKRFTKSVILSLKLDENCIVFTKIDKNKQTSYMF